MTLRPPPPHPTWKTMRAMARGKLRIYLGAAPGVGKTYAMLSEAHRRVERGTDCVVALRRAPRPAAHRGDAARPGAGPAPGARVPGRRLHRDGRGRGPGPRARPSPWSTSWPTPTCPARATPSAGRTSRSCSRPASTSSPRSTSSTWSRSATSSSRSPAYGSARPSPTRWCAGPTRSSWSTCRRRRCAAAWRTATSTSPTRSTRRCPTTSGPATSPRCASWRCCGWPTGSTSTSSSTAASTASRSTWRPRERIVVGLTGGPEGRTLIRRAARLAEKGAGGEVLAVYIARSDGLTSASPEGAGRPAHPGRGPRRHLPPRRRRRHPGRAAGLRARRQRHPDRARLQPPQGLAVRLRARASARPSPASPGPTSTSTSSPTRRPPRGAACPSPAGARLGRSRIIWGWLVGVGRPRAADAAADRTSTRTSASPTTCCCS